jgi:hypothetical protein
MFEKLPKYDYILSSSNITRAEDKRGSTINLLDLPNELLKRIFLPGNKDN